jgi:hypothetical protein
MRRLCQGLNAGRSIKTDDLPFGLPPNDGLGGDFTKNRDPLLEGEFAVNFLRAVLAQPKVKRLVSSDHFSIGGTLIEAVVSIKSLRRKGGSDNGPDGPGRDAECGFKQKKRSNATHRSTTDPECRLYKRADGQPTRLCYLGHALMENRHGLVVDGCLTLVTAEIYASKAPKRRAFCGTATPQPRVGLCPGDTQVPSRVGNEIARGLLPVLADANCLPIGRECPDNKAVVLNRGKPTASDYADDARTYK